MAEEKSERHTDLWGKKVVVVGLGRSGTAAARLLAAKGAEVWITDQRSQQELAMETERLKDYPVHFALGGHPSSVFSGASLAVISPGVPTASLSNLGIPVIGDVELASWFLAAPIVGITGTNGKSTTTTLVGEMFKAWGMKVFVGGNLGISLCEAVLSETHWDWVVAELSSFQLETIKTFCPQISVLLNVTPNHLDRYPSFSDYLAAKLRIFTNQKDEHWAVLNNDDPVSGPLRSGIKAGIASISRKQRPALGVWLEGDRLMSNIDRLQETAHRSGILLRGEHNVENVLAAVAVAQLAGCPTEIIRGTIGRFTGLEHRLEIVRRSRGITYANDSKATTVAAAASAINSFTEPIVLIAGGQDKGMDFALLKPLIAKKTRAVVLIGESRKTIREVLEGAVPIYEATSLKEAVDTANALASSGDVVLMSPACASFDMFRDYEDRGRQFKALVSALT